MKHLLLLLGFVLSCRLTAQVPVSYIEKSITPNFKMLYIPGGTFTMGCTSEQFDCEEDEYPTHQVSLSGFYMGEAEVTVAEFKTFVNETGYQTEAEKANDLYENTIDVECLVSWSNDITGKGFQPDDHPVMYVSFNDAIEYINWLNTKTIRQYRLPTEAEWEYAAREGGKAILHGNGKDRLYQAEANFHLEKQWRTCRVGAISDSVIVRPLKTTPVKTFKPNKLGLYDMAGNVYEWCSHYYEEQPDTVSPLYRSNIRGGAWMKPRKYCRVASRYACLPNFRSDYIGFRLVASE